MSDLDSKEWKRVQRRLGRRVRVLRLARDLDQFALARLAGYRNANVICDIEKGKYNPPLYKLYALAAVLDTTPEALVGKKPLKRASHGDPQPGGSAESDGLASPRDDQPHHCPRHRITERTAQSLVSPRQVLN